MRILGTGSRNWSDSGAVFDQLVYGIRDVLGVPETGLIVGHTHRITVVQGFADGLDIVLRHLAVAIGCQVEDHPADWYGPCVQGWCRHGPRRVDRNGRDYCQGAGPRRNEEMVAAGADLCLAFPIGRSVGTRDAITRARAAGIETRITEGRMS